MNTELRSALDNLKAAIARSEADGQIDDDEKHELRELLERLDDALEGPDDHEGLGEQFEEAAVRFESKHPTIAAVIRSAVDTLSGYGI